jgi:hypothetical protein
LWRSGLSRRRCRPYEYCSGDITGAVGEADGLDPDADGPAAPVDRIELRFQRTRAVVEDLADHRPQLVGGMLLNAGCEYGQGYEICRPLEPDDASEWLLGTP